MVPVGGGGGVMCPCPHNFRLFHRHRVRAVWEGGKRSTLALNEMLVGEKDPAQ